MKTVNEICPRCKGEKTHDDFFWIKQRSETKRYQECKDCISEIHKEQRKQKKEEKYFAY